jgi:hypothetical protein
MGLSAVARVTAGTWTACAVQDNIGFGLTPGGQLELKTTLCQATPYCMARQLLTMWRSRVVESSRRATPSAVVDTGTGRKPRQRNGSSSRAAR